MLFSKRRPIKAEDVDPAYREEFVRRESIVRELLKRGPVRDINDLIPPSNPKYPWVPNGWQMLCYYCNQPIFYEMDEKYQAGYRQRGPLGGTWRHENHEWSCKVENIRMDIDLPRCHVCQVQVSPHRDICSFAGSPSFHATTMSSKEAEVERWVERERGIEMHNALFDLLQVYEGHSSYHEPELTLNEAVRRVLKASPWGHSVK